MNCDFVTTHSENITHNNYNHYDHLSDKEVINLLSLNLKYFFNISKTRQTIDIVIFAIKNSSIDYMMNFNDHLNYKNKLYSKITLMHVVNYIDKKLMKNKIIINEILDKMPMTPKYTDLNFYIFRE